eukprot:TRINITY_DN292_c0_g1_i2.p1 TRINITY_DN292_c0_g1~~TRINITY_DN292_c0_g1_i2.p1  ORF type:complete len:212 (-),score=16.41 TRINITY_DN292_c0_g1_i2:358-993(-)
MVTTVLLFTTHGSLALKLSFAQRECITEQVKHQHDTIKLSFVSLASRHYSRGVYDISIFDPKGQTVAEKRAVSSEELEYVSGVPGLYTFCFTEVVRKKTSRTRYETKEIMIEVTIVSQAMIDHSEDKAKEEHLDEVWDCVGIVGHYLQDLRWQSRYQQELDVAHIQAAGAVRQQINNMLMLKVFVIFCVGFLQIFAVTHFFNFKRNRGILG